MRYFCWLTFAVTMLLTGPCFAQKLVDPKSVAPEFREAAEKRRAEQMLMVDCNHRADVAKVLPRDRAEHINHCLDTAADKQVHALDMLR